MSVTFYKFFENVIKGEDLTVVKEEHNKILKQIGINNESGEEFFDALKAVIEKLKTPSNTDDYKNELSVLLNNYVDITLNYIRNQPGLGKIPEDQHLRSNPRNKEFFDYLDHMIENTKGLSENPRAAYRVFSGEVAQGYAHFTILMVETSSNSLTQ